MAELGSNTARYGQIQGPGSSATLDTGSRELRYPIYRVLQVPGGTSIYRVFQVPGGTSRYRVLRPPAQVYRVLKPPAQVYRVLEASRVLQIQGPGGLQSTPGSVLHGPGGLEASRTLPGTAGHPCIRTSMVRGGVYPGPGTLNTGRIWPN